MAALFTWGSAVFTTADAAVDQLRRRTEHRWPSVDRVGRRPSRQSTGPGADEVVLEGVVLPAYKGSQRDVDALRDLVLEGRPHLLTAGHGDVYGQWVGTSLEETRELLFDDGAARRVSWNLTLAHYGTDDPEGRADTAEQQASAAAPVQWTMAAAEESAVDAASADEVAAAAAAASGRATGRSADIVSAALSVADAGGTVAEALLASRVAASRRRGAVASVLRSGSALDVGDGTTVDEIARRVYGSATADVVAAILSVNPGLAGRGTRLAAGMRVNLPEIAARGTTSAVAQLWD